MEQLTHRPDEMAGYLDFLMHRRRVESNNSLLQHFGFQEDPFRVGPDARYLFPSKTHLEALSSLENGFYNNRGFLAIIAPPGMGKTTLLYRFLEDTRDTARSTFIFDMDAECEPRDFVGYILRDFGISPASSSSEMHKQLSEALIKETEMGRKCVVVIDEAQNLSDAVLERVRLLTNFENSQGKLLQIILSGQPQLTEKLAHASLVQLRQRVSTICSLELLNAQETKDYIDYRLRQSGYEGEPLFTEEAMDLIADLSGGTPRTINNMCFNALSLCATMQLRQVDGDMVTKVAADMQLSRRRRKSARRISMPGSTDGASPWMHVQQTLVHWWQTASGEVKVWVPASIGAVVVAMLLIMRLSGMGGSQAATTTDDSKSSVIATPAANAPADAKDKLAAAKPAPKVKPPVPVPATAEHRPAPTALVAQLPKALPTSRPVTTEPPAPKLVGKSTYAAALLIINSKPAGADIEIDGAFVGNAPSTVSVGPGPHQVSIGKKGFNNWHKTLSVTGGTIHLDADLEQEPQGQ
jgi:Type II secretory pathway, component ExeA (predicted ATPase)